METAAEKLNLERNLLRDYLSKLDAIRRHL